ncbi:MAG: hypothetical protein WD007_02140 [Nitriliruptoraceae bacterium]
MADAPQDAQTGEPTEAEIRAYLEQLRNAEVDQVVAEVATALINAAQVKLGRSDARLLLDLVAVVADQVRGRVPDELTGQLDEALTQLRLAQVDAEKQLKAEGSAEPAQGPATTPSTDTGAGQSQGTGESSTAASDNSTGKRLWTPGS